MIDENAFGLLVAYFGLEDDEYAGEREDFVRRYGDFCALLQERLTNAPPAAQARGLDLGHALYLELLEDERQSDLIGWLRETRAALGEQNYSTVAVLTFGASWLDDQTPRPELTETGTIKLVRACLPSEPLRRALLAEAATHGDEEVGIEGWGPGLYLDVDAVEALGRKPKNAPTVLYTATARFYRGGS